jgi:hypothetical protein
MIDLSELQTDVIQSWGSTRREVNKNTPAGGYDELNLSQRQEDILVDVDAMLSELGFDSLASYISLKRRLN